ncbi:hypothetical protein SAMN05518800_6978 [Variovorax sp. YR752]|nr:hypothetical protein SAMN05518800_6978 [Variovorax sp. YR752]
MSSGWQAANIGRTNASHRPELKMLPSYYQCTSCRERFGFAHTEGYYYLNFDHVPPGAQVPVADLYTIPVRPGWCKDCATVCIVEDIAVTRVFEDAYGVVRAGRPVEYPLQTENLDLQQAQEKLAAYLRWRLERRHPARALCCGGTSYQFLDVAQPLLKHTECDFGVVEPQSQYFIGGETYRTSGVLSPANVRVYSGEGDLMGLLTWRSRDSDTWEVTPTTYSQSMRTEPGSA